MDMEQLLATSQQWFHATERGEEEIQVSVSPTFGECLVRFCLPVGCLAGRAVC